MKNYNQYVSVFILAGLASSCSLKNPQSTGTVSVSMPRGGILGTSNVMDLSGGNIGRALSGGGSNFANPTGLTSFQCYGLNVMGSGITPDPRFNCNGTSQMGIVAGFAPVGAGTVSAIVPAGPARTIQLFGIQSTVGCPSLNAILATVDPAHPGNGPNFSGIGQPYLLGQATTDVFSNVSVNITAAYNAANTMFNACGGGNNNGPPTLQFQSINGLYSVQDDTNYAAGCNSIGISANNVNNSGGGPIQMPSVQPVVTNVSAGGTVTLYRDSTCSTPLNGGYVNFQSGSQSATVYVRPTNGATSFVMSLQTTATDWSVPQPTTFQVVPNRINLTTSPQPTPVFATGTALTGSCTMINVMGNNSIGGSITFSGNYDLWATGNSYGNSGVAPPPSVEVYSIAANCTNGVIANAYTVVAKDFANGISKFSIPLTGNMGYLYVRDSVAENFNLSLSQTGSAVGAQAGQFTFTPYSATIGVNQSGLAGNPGQISFAFTNGTGSVVTGVSFFGPGGSVACPIASNNGTTLYCNPASVPTAWGGSYQVMFQVGNQYFNTGMQYNYLD